MLHLTARLRARLATSASIAAAALISACSCPQQNVLVDDFEGCTGTCGWSITGGSAAVVSTILPGEHGLRLTGVSTAVKSIPAVSLDPSWSLNLVAHCPSGLAATLAGSVPGQADAQLSVMLALDTSLTSSGDPPDYSGADYVPLVGTITWPMGLMSAGVHQITFQPSTGEACTIDVIRFTVTTPCGN